MLIQSLIWFESYVNSDGCQTQILSVFDDKWFESYVNSDGCQTMALFITLTRMFESYVNSDGCQTPETMEHRQQPV